MKKEQVNKSTASSLSNKTQREERKMSKKPTVTNFKRVVLLFLVLAISTATIAILAYDGRSQDEYYSHMYEHYSNGYYTDEHDAYNNYTEYYVEYIHNDYIGDASTFIEEECHNWIEYAQAIEYNTQYFDDRYQYHDYSYALYDGGYAATASRANQASSLHNRAFYIQVRGGSNLMLDMRGGYTHAGNNLWLWTQNFSHAQQFGFIRQWDGTYEIIVRNSNLFLQANSRNAGGLVVQAARSGQPAQRWFVRNVGNGYFQFVNRLTGNLIDVSGARFIPRNEIIHWPHNGSIAQYFRLIPVGTRPPVPYPAQYRVTARIGLNLRSESNSTSRILTAIPLNATITITEVRNGFGRTNWNNRHGWVSMQFVERIGNGGGNGIITSIDINDPSVFLKQQAATTCTLTAATMMIRRRAILDGYPNWRSITEASIRPHAWINGQGLRNSFTYTRSNGWSWTVQAFLIPQNSRHNHLVNRLAQRPEGIVVHHPGSDMHAVLLTDFQNNTFFAADPAHRAPSGRISLDRTVMRGNNQSQILSNLRTEWIITSRRTGS